MHVPNVIRKYRINIGPTLIPASARILSAGWQPSSDGAGVADIALMVWAEVDPDEGLSPRMIRVVPTGREVPRSGAFVGTVQIERLQLVFHVYDCGPA